MRLVVMTALVMLLAVSGVAGARDDGVSSLPEFRGPFPDTENMVFHGQVTPTDMGALPIELFGIAKGFASDIEQWTSPAGEQYALVTHSGGIGFIRVTDPDDVQFVGTIPAFIPDPVFNVTHLWGDPDTWGTYGYFTREGFGDPFTTDLIIVDLSGLDALEPAAPGTDISSHLPTALVRPGGYEGAHNIEIDSEGYAYLPGTHLEHGAANNACGVEEPAEFNMLILDVKSDPMNPSVAACIPNTAEHDVFVVNDYDGPDSDYQGRDIAFIFDGFSGMTFIWDVTDKANISVIAEFSLASEGLVFSHNGVPTEDLTHLFIGDELDELFDSLLTGNKKPEIGTYIVDIHDLDSPVFDERYTDGSVGIDHNFVVKGDRLYVASYNSGTRVFDIVDEGNGSITLSPIAHMDTEPRLPNKIFNLNQELKFVSNFLGQWGIDVFDDGTIIVSDLNNGVVVMSLSDEPCRGMKCSK
ncbi:MAG: choice-of-anchor B family protein [Acidimicrobiia bacterium]|nr:choice-of-anchor B family protein [Acidimicrobiia bacterium]